MKKHFRNTVVIAILAALIAASLSGCTSAEQKSSAAPQTEQKEEPAPAVEDDTKEPEPDAVNQPEEVNVFDEMTGWNFVFCSGAGGWETHMSVTNDGSFAGEYYDGEMGDTGADYPNGVMYSCKFTGRFTDPEKIDAYAYKLKVSDLKYEKNPGNEEIIDGTKYIYTDAYGIGTLDSQPEMTLYLGGAKMSNFSEDQMTWLNPTHFTMFFGEQGTDTKYVLDTPDELPFPVLCSGDNLFYSENVSDKNKTFLINRAKLPGLHNITSELHEDGTYLYEDMDDDGMFLVKNVCFTLKGSFDIYGKADEFVNECLKNIYTDGGISDVYARGPRDMYSLDYDNVGLNGTMSDYATFTHGSNEDQRSCCGRFFRVDGYENESSFVYAYIIEMDVDNDSEILDSAIAADYTSSLMFTGRSDSLSSAGDGKAPAEKVLCNTIAGDKAGTVRGQKVIWVTEEDTDLIKEYNLDPNDFYNDYQTVTPDKTFNNYEVSEGCPFYVQFPKDEFHKYMDLEGFETYAGRDEKEGRLMRLYLDDSGKVVYAAEVYTP